jgi:hypothetical protein
MKKQKMNTKIALVSFIAVLSLVFLAAGVSAGELAKAGTVQIKVDDRFVNLQTPNVIPVTAGDTIAVKVEFTADAGVFDDYVTVSVELEGDKIESRASSKVFPVRENGDYTKAVSIQVPYELKDKLYDSLTLNVKIKGEDDKTEFNDIKLSVERPPYNPDIKSISVDQQVTAGEQLPVDVVLKNIGYNNLDDLYIKASISELGITKTGYFGDLVALECDNSDTNEFPWSETTLDRKCNEDDKDTVAGRLFLSVPYDVKSGVYTLEVEVRNDDVDSKKSIQVTVDNEFEKTVFKSGNSLWIVNPTNNVVGYRVVPESPASVSESIVFVPAGASKEIEVSTNAEGEYAFDVKVFTLDGELVDTVSFSGSGSVEQNETNPIVILTIILAIVFIVLLIVLIVLIGKKPEKTGEFGESYY